MSAEHKGDAPVKNASTELGQSANVQGEEVVYATIDGEEITGYLAKPDNAETGAHGIIVIHEWWGLNDNIRMMADKLAAEGYAALAVDLYEGNVAETSDEAKKYMQSVLSDTEGATENLKQAYQYLAQQQDEREIGVIGWCFGGGWSLETALALPQKIDATVIYYGRLVTDPQRLEKLDMPVIGFFGAEDNGIPREKVKAFEAALNEVGVTNSIYIYEGAGHAFANPSGTRYQAKAAEDAWQKTVAFLNEYLK
jgi:carboxymethylenebutenolidase